MHLNLAELSREDIANNTLSYIDETLFKTYPMLKEQAALIIVGSVALGDFDESSDIDLNFILPETVVNTPVKEYKEKLKEDNSQIEVRLARTYEVLEQYLNWNDDYILGEYQNGIVLQDPTGRFTKLIQNFKWYPKDILEAKINWLFHEITYSIYKDFQPLLTRSTRNIYFEEVVKTRVVRYLLTALRLINSKYPIHDKKLFINTKKLTNNKEVISSIRPKQL